MAGYIIVVLCVLPIVLVDVARGCDINKCVQNNQILVPQSCQAYTQMLQCIQKEFDACKTDAGKTHIMMRMHFVMHSGRYCGFNAEHMTQMMTARAGMMTSMMNGTNGIMAPMMMGDDGPFDMDDGPFDDGPFDDGPFDDGPFNDMGGHGMIPFLAAGGAGNTAGTDNKQPPQAPGLLPSFGGGSMMQSNEGRHDQDSSAGHTDQSWSLLTTTVTLCLMYLCGQ